MSAYTETSAPVKNTSSPYRTYSLPAFTPAEIDAMIFARIVWHCAGKGLCWVGDATLARDLGLTIGQVSESINRQCQSGEIGIEHRQWRRYLLIAQTTQFVQNRNSAYKDQEEEKEEKEEELNEEERRNNNKEETVVVCLPSLKDQRALIDSIESALDNLHASLMDSLDTTPIPDNPPESRSEAIPPAIPCPDPKPAKIAPEWKETAESPGKNVPDPVIVAMMTDRKITRIAAEDRATRIPAEKIERDCRAYDLALKNGKAKGSGWLLSAIDGEFDHANLAAAEKRQEQSRQRDEGINQRCQDNAKDRESDDRKQTYWDNLSTEEQAAILAEAEANLRDRGIKPDPRGVVWKGFVGIEKWAIIDKRLSP